MDEIRAEALATIGTPARRAGEISDLVAHLASDTACSVAGEAIGVDGGVHLNTRSLTRRG